MKNMGIQQMDMQKLQEMQACMARIDHKQLEAMEEEQNAFQAEMKSLCASGKRAAAQNKAMSYAKDMMNRPVMKEIRKCGEMAAKMMPGMPFTQKDSHGKEQHVCDAF